MRACVALGLHSTNAAFRFIDLNKNMFIGASEIRHVLICMGELITDEEVDEMISMVDSDGDGQVRHPPTHPATHPPTPALINALHPRRVLARAIRHSSTLFMRSFIDQTVFRPPPFASTQVNYEEFYMLITDPDPGRPDFDVKEGLKAAAAAEEDMTKGVGKHGHHLGDTTAPNAGGKVPLSTQDKARELQLKQQKKVLLTGFANENHVRIDTLERVWDKVRAPHCCVLRAVCCLLLWSFDWWLAAVRLLGLLLCRFCDQPASLAIL